MIRMIAFLPLLLGTALAQERGVIRHSDKASPGYTLIAPFGGQETFLIDLRGRVVHSWSTEAKPSQAAYLLEDGSLLRTTKIENDVFNITGGPAGGIQKFDWDGNLLWDFAVSDATKHAHHDIEPLPNGNVLVVAWERKTTDEAVAHGRDPAKIAQDEHPGVWPEVILEIQPDGKTGGKVVWEWHVWDHVVQDFDPSKPNYGAPAEHPELVDLNHVERPVADWIHMNSVDYNPELDQIMMCGRTFDEVWIIDHSTTTDEAARHSGGSSGKGGDLLYRWGNPVTYGAGTPEDQKLFGQHDPHWIPAGVPGAGNILIFNNGHERDNRPFSSVDELTPPVTDDGGYSRAADTAFGPPQLTWQYVNRDDFFSTRVSGAQRLPNGNTLICSGEQYRVFEVDPQGSLVWDFRNYLGGFGPEAEEDYEDPNQPNAAPATGDASRRGRTRRGQGRRPPQRAAAGPLGGVAMFRALRYAPDYPAFDGRLLKPL